MRSERRLSVTEVSKHTKIQAKYLEYMEEGDYSKLPADVYVKGFLRSWASYMGIGEQPLIKQYEREKGIHKNIRRIEDTEKAVGPIRFSKLVVTPKLVIATALALSVLSIFFYLYREVNTFVSQPRLVIMRPADGETIDGKVVRMTGVTEKDALMTVNDQPVLVNEKGEFSQDIGLQEGLNVITVKARNRFDKESVKAVTVNAAYENALEDEAPQMEAEVSAGAGQFSLEIYASPNPAWLSVEADGNLVYSGTLDQGNVQKIEAKEKVAVTSSNGSGTFIRLNGKDLGALGPKSEAVKDAVFTAEGKREREETN